MALIFLGSWGGRELYQVSQRISIKSALAEARENAAVGTKRVVLSHLNGEVAVELPTDYIDHTKPLRTRLGGFQSGVTFDSDVYLFSHPTSQSILQLGHFKSTADVPGVSFDRSTIEKLSIRDALETSESAAAVDLVFATDEIGTWYGLPMRVASGTAKEGGQTISVELRMIGNASDLFFIYAGNTSDMHHRARSFLDSLTFTPPFASSPLRPESSLFQIPDDTRSVNVSELINPSRDATVGQWVTFDGGVASPPSNTGAILTLPIAVPKAYRIELSVQRVGGTKPFSLGLPIAASMAHVVIDRPSGGDSISGLSSVDRKLLGLRPEAVRGIELGFEPTRIVAEVRQNEISVICGSKTIVDWNGAPSSLSFVGNSWAYERGKLFVGSQSSEFIVRDIQLTQLD